MGYLLGIDIGTSGTKTLVCDHKGKVLATAMAEHDIFAPKPGWSEQDPIQWWDASCKATKAVLAKAKVKGNQITAIGLSGQMHGSVFLGDSEKPLRNALLWNDQRTAVECAEIEKLAGGRKALINQVGNPALTGFTAPKILWVRKNEPKVYEKTKHILLPKDYIRFRMTGEFATEVGDASGTLLLDVKNRKWNKKVIDLLKIDHALLPACFESHIVSGKLHKAGAAAMGLVEGIPPPTEMLNLVPGAPVTPVAPAQPTTPNPLPLPNPIPGAPGKPLMREPLRPLNGVPTAGAPPFTLPGVSTIGPSLNPEDAIPAVPVSRFRPQ